MRKTCIERRNFTEYRKARPLYRRRGQFSDERSGTGEGTLRHVLPGCLCDKLKKIYMQYSLSCRNTIYCGTVDDLILNNTVAISYFVA